MATAEQHLLGLTVRCQLCCIYDHCPTHGWNASSPQSQHSFFASDSNQSIENSFIISAVSQRKSSIGSHSNQRNFGRTSKKCSHSPGHHAQAGFDIKIGLLSLMRGRKVFQQSVVNSHSNCRVRSLSQQSRRQSCVHSGDAFIFDDCTNQMQTCLVFLGLASDTFS